MSDTQQDPFGYAEGWRPEAGDMIVGTVKELAVGYSKWGSYPIVTVTPEGGGDGVAIHGFHAALYNRLRQLKPRVGERIGVQYQGQRPSKSNPEQTVSVYIVRIQGRDGSEVWDQLDQENAPPPPATFRERTPRQQEIPAAARDYTPPHTDDDIPF